MIAARSAAAVGQPLVSSTSLTSLPRRLVGSLHRSTRVERLALAAIGSAVLMFMAVGANLATSAAPWRWSDEQAHVGYAMEVSRGRLPSVDTLIPVPSGAPNLERRLAATPPTAEGPDPHVKVWVANHPPGAYLFATPVVWVGELIRDGGGILLAMRLANVVGGAAAIGATALLAHELTRSIRVAALAAALVASTPYLQFITSTAMTDGFTLALSTGVVWAACRAQRLGFDRGSTTAVAVLAAACGLTRMTALGVAVAAVGTSLLVTAARTRSVPWRPAALVTLAVALSSGWFWVANVVRYGDVAGSQVLYDRFDRAPTGGLIETFFDADTWERLIDTLLSQQRDLASMWPGQASASTVVMVTLGVVGLLAVMDRAASVTAGVPRPEEAPPVGRAPGSPLDPAAPRATTVDHTGWMTLGAASVASGLMVAQHVSAGGNPFARYVLSILPFLACAVSAGLVGGRRRLTATVAGMAILGHQLLMSYRYFADSEAAEALRRPSYLDPTMIGPDWIRAATAGAGAVFGAFLVLSLALALASALPAGDHLPARRNLTSGPSSPGDVEEEP